MRPALTRYSEVETADRLAESVRSTDSAVLPNAEFARWFAERSSVNRLTATPVSFADLPDWDFDATTGNLGHRSGRFFSVEGVEVHSGHSPFGHWAQPIINQTDIGILGIVVKRIDGVLHCLMQAKVEPGNINGLQLSPTVQATHSNYTRVHGGRAIPYLEHFLHPRRGRILVDVLQSEQGSWFLHKRNRNMVVEVDEDVPLHEDFCWLTLGQVLALLRTDNLVNMDARTVLSCLPFAPSGRFGTGGDPFTSALVRSLDAAAGAVHRDVDVTSWFTEAKATTDLTVRRIPLAAVHGWERRPAEIRHADGGHFRILPVAVDGASREVGSWTQPLLEPVAGGLIALLAKEIDGVLHFLIHARAQHGYLDRVELAPTVQCIPETYRDLPAERRPPYLDHVLHTDPTLVRYDVLQSEEGGRFRHAENRYLVAEVGPDFPEEVPAQYRWTALHQLTELLRHSHYLNVEARTLVTCLQSLW